MPCSEDDDSQGFASESTQGLSKAELRKTNKPIMEKKRRARINNCLNELKDLLIDTSDKDSARHSKLEKADILEMTVKHLQTLQRQQLAAAIAADPAVLHRFKSGFGDCALEVRRYLSRLASVPTGLRHRLGTHLNSCITGIEHLHQPDYPPLVPDPLRLENERPSAFHFVRSTRPSSPPLSPMSCDSACDSSTELDTPPRPVQTYPFPTPPSRSASDQDSSPDTQKPTVSSTTISPETLRQEALRNKKFLEPLSIVIDVENYKIGIDSSPKRAVDYSMRQKLKRPVVGIPDAATPPKVIRLEQDTGIVVSDRFERVSRERREGESFERVVFEKIVVPEKVSAFVPVRLHKHPQLKIPISPLNFQTVPERKLIIPESIPTPVERPSVEKIVITPMQRSVISHTAETLAKTVPGKSDGPLELKKEVPRPKSPEQGGSNSTPSEMWRPW